MKKLGYYAKDKDNNLYQFEWGANDKLYLHLPNVKGIRKVEVSPKDYEIVEIGFFTAD